MEDDDILVVIHGPEQNASLKIKEKQDLSFAVSALEQISEKDLGIEVGDVGEEDLIGWVNQLDQEIDQLEDHLGELDARIGEKNHSDRHDQERKIAKKIACLKLREKVEEGGIPEDWHKYHREIRDEMGEEGVWPVASVYVHTVENYTRDVREELETEAQRDGVEDASDEAVGDVDDEGIKEARSQHESGENEREDASEKTGEQSDTVKVPELDEIDSLEDIREYDGRVHRRVVRKVIEENYWIDRQGVGYVLFGERPVSGSKEYVWINDQIMAIEDGLESKKDGRSRLYAPEGTPADENQGDRIEGAKKLDEISEEDVDGKGVICVNCCSKEAAFTDLSVARVHRDTEDHDNWLIINDDGPWNNNIAIRGLIERELGQEVLERVRS